MDVACTALFLSICPDMLSSRIFTFLVSDRKLVQQPADEQWAALLPLAGCNRGLPPVAATATPVTAPPSERGTAAASARTTRERCLSPKRHQEPALATS